METSTYTITLPSDLMDKLTRYSKSRGENKNKLIEKSLRKFFDEMKKEEYARSFQRAKGDEEQITMAEEGMAEYIRIIDRSN